MDAERNLLFGLFALQAELINDAQFAEVRTDLANRVGADLGELLVERGWLTQRDREHLDYLLDRRLAKYDGDARACLAAARATGEAANLATSCPPSLPDWEDLTPPPPPALPLNGGPSGSAHAATAGPAGGLAYAPAPPTQAGASRYALLRLHAVGGIGRIWLTRDGAFGRQVALKELRPETARHPRVQARFLEEARITGQLEHPGIVPVYELCWRDGTGEPFYTMRFVKGRTLSEASRAFHEQRPQGKAGALEQRELLSAFVAVCNTLAYAHARGVIHRDLKGQNVLLGDFGEVIVLDWGLAKVMTEGSKVLSEEPGLDSSLSTQDSSLTQQGQVLGTPAYMPPEQAAGQLDRVTARSDVYGLGAMLYEILTGRPPFTGTDSDDVLRKVQTEQPPRPGQVVAGVPAALEAVCLKALAHAAEQRYATAADLAGDVRRWLADEPVSAYREPFTVRLSRWARRHRTLVTGAGALLSTAVVALGVSTFLIGQQKARAEENFRLARDAVEKFYVRVSEEKLLHEPGLQPLRKSLLETARDFFQRFVDENAEESGRRADLAATLIKLGRVTAEIDDTAGAIVLLLRARTILEDLMRQHPHEVNTQHELAMCYNSLGGRYRDAGQLLEALAMLQRGVDTVEPLAAAPGSSAEHRSTYALCLNNLGVVHRDLNEPDKAEAVYLAARGVQERLVAEQPDQARFRSDLAGTFNNLAAVYTMLGQHDRALRAMYEAHAVWGQLVATQGQAPEYRENLAMSHRNLALVLKNRNEAADAWDHCQRCLEIYRRLIADNPAVTGYRSKLVAAHITLGDLYVHIWESVPPERKSWYLAEARHAYTEALSSAEKLVRDHPHVTRFALDHSTACVSLGNLFSFTNQWPDALHWYEQSLKGFLSAGTDRRRGVDERRHVTTALWGRADTLAKLGRHAEAVPDWDRAVDLADRDRRATLRAGRAVSLARLGQHSRAAAEVSALVAEYTDRTDLLLQLVQVLAVSASAAGTDGTCTPQERLALRESYATSAVSLLRAAHKAGLLKEATIRKSLTNHADFEALQPRPDFKVVLRLAEEGS